MFDPQSLSYRNRRIQKQAQILRSKGTTFIPQRTYGPNEYKEMQRILIANKIQAYVPEQQFSLPILIDGLSIDGSSVNFPFSYFDYTATEIQSPEYHNYLIYIQKDGEVIDFVIQYSENRKTIPANTYYYTQKNTVDNVVFHSPTIGFFVAANIDTNVPTKVSFNTDIFQLTGLESS